MRFTLQLYSYNSFDYPLACMPFVNCDGPLLQINLITISSQTFGFTKLRNGIASQLQACVPMKP